MSEPIKSEVVYETIEHVELRLHVFKSSVPSSQAESAPVMVIFHGTSPFESMADAGFA